MKSGTEINKDVGIKATIEEFSKDIVPQMEEKEAKEKEKDQTTLPPPFPQRLQKNKLDKQFARFLEVFKNPAHQHSIFRSFGRNAQLCQIHERHSLTKTEIGRLRDSSIDRRMKRHHSEETSPEIERS